MPSQAINYLESGELIEARLKEQYPDMKVMSVNKLADVENLRQFGDHVFLYYDGYRVVSSSKTPGQAMIEFTWVCVAAVKHAKSKFYSEAGVAHQQMLNALMGWKPSKEYSELRLVDTYKPSTVTGFGFFPLAFTTSCTLKSPQADFN